MRCSSVSTSVLATAICALAACSSDSSGIGNVVHIDGGGLSPGGGHDGGGGGGGTKVGDVPIAAGGNLAGDAGTIGPAIDSGTIVGNADAQPTPFCRAFSETCATGPDCCSGLCDLTSHTCVSSINKCTLTGGACQAATECCSLACVGGLCSATACIADGQSCTTAASCCGGNCEAGVCKPLSTACKTAGNPCTAGSQCCSTLCEAGVCKLGASFCIQNGDACSDSTGCCSGDCQKAAGAALGVCALPATGASYCNGGIDGTVCGGCTDCCSRLCEPYAPTGVKICQPASGCRIEGQRLLRRCRHRFARRRQRDLRDFGRQGHRYLPQPARLRPARRRMSFQAVRLQHLFGLCA